MLGKTEALMKSQWKQQSPRDKRPSLSRR